MDFRHELVIPDKDLPFRMFIFEGRDGNYKVTKHWHQSVEIFLVMEGTIGFFINNQYYPLHAGDFVLVNANEIHSIDAPEPNTTIVLQIPASSFEGYMGDEEAYMTFEKKGEEGNTKLRDLVTDMFSVYDEAAYGYQLRVKSLFFELLYVLVTRFRVETMDEEAARQKRHLDRLSKVTRYMKENYNQELCLNEVARRFGFTPTYLSRMFQQYAQVSYRTYLIDLRVKYAARDLTNTDREIMDIAMEHGFPDSRSFAKAFKKRYGYLPSQYRKNINLPGT